jgi:hypothetical protein
MTDTHLLSVPPGGNMCGGTSCYLLVVAPWYLLVVACVACVSWWWHFSPQFRNWKLERYKHLATFIALGPARHGARSSAAKVGVHSCVTFAMRKMADTHMLLVPCH